MIKKVIFFVGLGMLLASSLAFPNQDSISDIGIIIGIITIIISMYFENNKYQQNKKKGINDVQTKN